MKRQKQPAQWDKFRPGESQSWGTVLGGLYCPSVFQDSAWGQYKNEYGWQAHKWIAREGEQPVAAAQVLVRKASGGISVAWVPGGPVFHSTLHTTNRIGEYLKAFLEKTQSVYGSRLYLRCNMTCPATPENRFQVASCLHPTLFKINSGFSRTLIVPDTEADCLKTFSKKHRYYARKALEAPVQWRSGYSERLTDDFLRIHGEMTAAKKLGHIAADKVSIRRLLDAFNRKAFILNGYENKVPITTCLILTSGEEGFYFLGATNREGREINAAYGMFVQLFNELHARNITRFDFGGIHPSEASGVNHFKKGFGGDLIEYTGEWDWSVSPWLRIAVNALIALRGGLR